VDFAEFISKIIACGICLFLIAMVVLICAAIVIVPVQLIQIAIHPKVEVFVDQKLIYKGSDVCVDITSSGFNTTVKTSKFLCIMPDKSYTSKDVFIRTVE
jgi:hypothetical protein